MSTEQRMNEILDQVGSETAQAATYQKEDITAHEINILQQNTLTLLCDYCAHHPMDSVSLEAFTQAAYSYSKTMIRIKDAENRIKQAYLADPQMQYMTSSSLNAYLHLLNTKQIEPLQRYTIAMQYLDHINACLDTDPQEPVSTNMSAVMLLATAKNYGWEDGHDGEQLTIWQRIKDHFLAK